MIPSREISTYREERGDSDRQEVPWAAHGSSFSNVPISEIMHLENVGYIPTLIISFLRLTSP